MKTLTMVILTTMALATGWAEENKLAIKASWETAADNIYLGSEGLVLHNKPILENSLTLQFSDSGLSAGIWTAFPLQKQAIVPESSAPTSLELSQTGFDASGNEQVTTLRLNFTEGTPSTAAAPFDGEVDIFAGWEKEFSSFKLNSKLTYWLIGDLSDPADDVWSANLKVSLPDCPLIQPFVEFEHTGEIGRLSPKSGNLLFAGLTRNQDLGHSGQKLDLEFRSAWSDGALGVEHGWQFCRLSASMDIKAGKNWHIVPSAAYQLNNHENEEKDQLLARLGIRLDF